MKPRLKNEKDLELLKISGERLALILKILAEAVRPGISTKSLDVLAEKEIRKFGDIPAFLNYTPYGAKYPYPASLCVSVNDEVVHGIPGERILKEGDIVGLDLGVSHEGRITDAALTVAVGQISKEAQDLISATKKALMAGISAIRLGGYIGDIGRAIEKSADQKKYGLVKILGGHGVGFVVHEGPYIHNFDTGMRGEKIVPGMVLAIEPMLTLGSDELFLAKDGYTFKTSDQSLSAHFEHTVAVMKDKVVVLTK